MPVDGRCKGGVGDRLLSLGSVAFSSMFWKPSFVVINIALCETRLKECNKNKKGGRICVSKKHTVCQ